MDEIIYLEKKSSDNDYYDEFEEKYIKCTCKDNDCNGCKGTCGCPACHRSYGDFLTFPE